MNNLVKVINLSLAMLVTNVNSMDNLKKISSTTICRNIGLYNIATSITEETNINKKLKLFETFYTIISNRRNLESILSHNKNALYIIKSILDEYKKLEINVPFGAKELMSYYNKFKKNYGLNFAFSKTQQYSMVKEKYESEIPSIPHIIVLSNAAHNISKIDDTIANMNEKENNSDYKQILKELEFFFQENTMNIQSLLYFTPEMFDAVYSYQKKLTSIEKVTTQFSDALVAVQDDPHRKKIISNNFFTDIILDVNCFNKLLKVKNQEVLQTIINILNIEDINQYIKNGEMLNECYKQDLQDEINTISTMQNGSSELITFVKNYYQQKLNSLYNMEYQITHCEKLINSLNNYNTNIELKNILIDYINGFKNTLTMHYAKLKTLLHGNNSIIPYGNTELVPNGFWHK